MIKRIIYLLIPLASISVFSACKKNNDFGFPASVLVVNAMPTANPVVLLIDNNLPGNFSTARTVPYKQGVRYSPPNGSRSLSIAQLSDTAKTIFSGSFQLNAGGAYSLYFAGDTTHPDTLLLKDNIVNYSDDSAGVRFLNLASGNKQLSINISGGAPGDFATLGYKEASSFKKFDAGVNSPGGYIFEIRDPVTGDFLQRFVWRYIDHKNNTVVIAGSPDPSSPTPLVVFSVNHY